VTDATLAAAVDLSAVPADSAPLRAVDRVTVEPAAAGWHAVGDKAVVASDPYLDAHYPGRPVYPGIFLLETVRQSVRAALHAVAGAAADLRELRSVRFTAPVLPGDRLVAHCSVRPAGGGWEVDAACTTDGGRAARVRAVFSVPGSVAPEPAPRPTPDPEPAAAAPGPSEVDHPGVRAMLPHGHPMVLVDRVEWCRPGVELEATKAVSGTERCYAALPPGTPAERYGYPVSLLLESFGQAALVLWRLSHAAEAPRTGSGGRPGEAADPGVLLLGAVRGLHVEGRAYPGDVLRHRVRLDSVVADTAFAAGEVWAGSRRVATVASAAAAIRPQRALEPAPGGRR
jgi:3-hydroxymyristoyl/3-hydroxydecanoyl-(acyl carrier protein) dehydratase